MTFMIKYDRSVVTLLIKTLYVHALSRATDKAVKAYIRNEILERLPEGMQVPPERIIGTRWVLSWKKEPEEPLGKKGQRRIVLLGYQDTELTTQATLSPTKTRLARQVFLKACATLGLKLEKGDVSAAFLQGRPEPGTSSPSRCQNSARS